MWYDFSIIILGLLVHEKTSETDKKLEKVLLSLTVNASTKCIYSIHLSNAKKPTFIVIGATEFTLKFVRCQMFFPSPLMAIPISQENK